MVPTLFSECFRRCFFFNGEDAADFQGHLRRADYQFQKLYKHMGVKKSPDASDFAALTQRVAEKIQRNKDTIIEDDLKVLQACVKGFHWCCIQSLEDESWVPLTFSLPDEDKNMAEVSELVAR